MSLLNNKTTIIKSYAGYYNDNELLVNSSSGGIASYLAKRILEENGIVYGVTYSKDYYFAHYQRIYDSKDINRIKGSKYCYVRKEIYLNGVAKSVFEAASEDIINGKKVLFIGLSCDVYALVQYLKNHCIFFKNNLFTIELLCAGTTEEIVQREYVKFIEHLHKSKVREFTVRYKRDGWNPVYLRAEFENGEEHIIPFYESIYGLAFMYFKRKACYSCKFKGKNRYADLTIGDYRGCEEWMPEYNENGVSIIYIQTEKGKQLIKRVDTSLFILIETDSEFALRHSPRYFKPSPENPEWENLNLNISTIGLIKTFRKGYRLFSDNYLKDFNLKDKVMWGAGYCFHKLGHYVLELTKVLCVVDEDPHKWTDSTEYGISCVSPKNIRKKDVFVIIMVDKAEVVCQIINELISMNIHSFVHVRDYINSTEYRENNLTERLEMK